MTKITITTSEKEENAWASFLVSEEDMPAIIQYAQNLHTRRISLSNEQLAKYGFQLSEMSGDCYSCEKYTEKRNRFWHGASCDYYCRECAGKEVSKFFDQDREKLIPRE